MTVFRFIAPSAIALLLGALAPAVLPGALTPVHAQQDTRGDTDGVTDRVDSFKRDTGDFFGRMFGRDEAPGRRDRDERPAREPSTVTAQMSSSDLVVRLDRLENTLRQLTGSIEQLQYRNQQLEQQMKRMQEDVDFRFQEQGKTGGTRPPARPQAGPPPQQSIAPAPSVQQGPPPSPPSGPAGRRSDAFDPNANPTAPGVPQSIGSTPSSGPPPVVSANNDDGPGAAPVGVPGGRQAGAPLDLSTLSANAANDPALRPGAGPQANATSTLPPPPARNPSATGGQQHVALPPNISTKDEYDAAYGSLLRKDYAVAEESFRVFLKKHPADRLSAEANYWLGESLFQRQRYRDAAESYLAVSTRFEKSAKAPEALLRLGQSLAALNERESACGTLAEIARKYPKAPASVKQGVEREQKRARCG